MARFFVSATAPAASPASPLITVRPRLIRRHRRFAQLPPSFAIRLSRVPFMNSKPIPVDNPLAQGNRVQRAYYHWALPYYERFGQRDPLLREQVEAVDRLLYTRSGAAIWLGWLGAIAVAAWGLNRGGMPWGMALGLSLLGGASIALTLICAWLSPLQGLDRRKRLRLLIAVLVGLPFGGMVGSAVGQYVKRGYIDWVSYSTRLQASLDTLVPALLGTGLFLLLLAWLASKASQAAQAQRLARAELLAERDAARANAAETELRLLQVQIHPHFVFNTLATLQHWVDKADPRAGPLLRELTGFLRRSTEMLGRQQVPLAEEAQSAAHYLAIMQTRMGDRLQTQIDIDPRCGQQTLPPGLLLTLVENAIEHGLEPKIGGGTLQIHSACTDTGWWLRVDDDGIGLAPTASDNVGLSNLRLRLQQHYGPSARFNLSPRPEGGTRAEICFEENPCPAS